MIFIKEILVIFTAHSKRIILYYLFSIGIFEAVFLFLLLLSKRNKKLPDFILGGIFILFGLNILCSLIEHVNRTNGYPFPAFIQTTPPIILLHGPLLWFYIKSQTERSFRFRSKNLLHIVPFLTLFLYLLVAIYSSPENQKIQLDMTEGFKKLPGYSPLLMMILISPPAYYFSSLILLKKHNDRLKKFYSKIDTIDLRWLRLLVLVSLCLSLLINLTFFVDYFLPLATFSILQAVGFLFVSIYVLFMGFFGLKQGAVLAYQPDATVENPLEPKLAPDGPESDLIDRLFRLMKEKQLYTNPDLTLAMLAQELEVREGYLSLVLNHRLNLNFFDFVNQFRVEAFKTKCKDSSLEHLTFMALAYDCGFNSKATFNRVFKRVTTLTPSEYKKGASEK